MREFFPDLILLNSVDRNIFDSDTDEYSVLIDSRSPLWLYDYLIRNSARMRKIILCIMLDMRYQEQEAQLLSLKFMSMSLMPLDMASLFRLLANINGKILTVRWLNDLRLSVHEKKMLQLLKDGMTMEEAASELDISAKGLYRMRTALCERLQVENFNEACLFIFKNKLLDLDKVAT
ncbi:LuxR C-terminal-related transcriptional regulator (plasmid) [Escherichia coli O170:H18]|nr:LuxR family transcriptional regulator [Escherichia coli]QWV76972.1 LuxR C-terminal-related transcriptional regulator [Escherichia coli O170:H18]